MALYWVQENMVFSPVVMCVKFTCVSSQSWNVTKLCFHGPGILNFVSHVSVARLMKLRGLDTLRSFFFLCLFLYILCLVSWIHMDNFLLSLVLMTISGLFYDYLSFLGHWTKKNAHQCSANIKCYILAPSLYLKISVCGFVFTGLVS